jgi:large subunit ribosomal protein L4
MPAKARRVALRAALAGKLADGEVVIADLGEFAQPSSKSARKILNDLDATRRACVVVAERDENLWKSFRNFPGVNVRSAVDVSAYDVVAGGLVIAESTAMEALAARVGRLETAGGEA